MYNNGYRWQNYNHSTIPSNNSLFDNRIANLNSTDFLPKSEFGTQKITGTGTDYLGMADTGLSIFATIGGLYQARQNYKLAKNEFKFNKMNANRNYQLAKDAYDRKVARADHIARASREANQRYIQQYGDPMQRVNPNPRSNTNSNINKPQNTNRNTTNKPRIAEV